MAGTKVIRSGRVVDVVRQLQMIQQTLRQMKPHATNPEWVEGQIFGLEQSIQLLYGHLDLPIDNPDEPGEGMEEPM